MHVLKRNNENDKFVVERESSTAIKSLYNVGVS